MKKYGRFGQENNNRSSVRLTWRCGQLFASSVIAGQSQWAPREALTNDCVTCGGGGWVMERFPKA